jgi:hypothetical protein
VVDHGSDVVDHEAIFIAAQEAGHRAESSSLIATNERVISRDPRIRGEVGGIVAVFGRTLRAAVISASGPL